MTDFDEVSEEKKKKKEKRRIEKMIERRNKGMGTNLRGSYSYFLSLFLLLELL